MNFGIVLKVIGSILIVEALLMLPSVFISLYFGEGDYFAFIISSVVTLTVGILLVVRRKNSRFISPRDGLAIVSMGWLLTSFFGAIPYYLSGSTDTFLKSFFESVSGFTSTGATVIPNLDLLPAGILFWRSLTQWIGGMGILVFTLALLPALGIGGYQIFKAELPGPVAGKIAPRLKNTAKILYLTYFTLTMLVIVFLKLGGMNLHDAIIYAFGTVGTGGFSDTSVSIGGYNSTYIHIIIGIFMVLSGINFSLFFLVIKGRIKEIFHDEELVLYIGIIITTVILISLNLYLNSYDSLGMALKDAFFHVSSIITTTGYSTVDFNLWPPFSKAILLFLMLLGGCAGSTVGGIKLIRILILFKQIKREIMKTFHSRAILPIKCSGKILSDEVVASVNAFTSLYLLVFGLSTIIISLEGIDIETAASSVAATLSNVGPGLGLVGPTRHFGDYSNLSLMFFTFLMLLGRLELFTIISLLSPRKWTRES